MKKFILTCFIVSSIIACSPKTETTSVSAYPAEAVGYNLDSSANIDLVKKTSLAFDAMDSVNYRASYAENAKFHDNGTDMTLEQNLGNFAYFKANGLTNKTEKIDPIWEVVNKEASPDGVTNYVISFQHLIIKKGDKEVKVIINVVNGIKDGKIVEEWGLYNTKPIVDLINQK
ncbi:MAG: hypothetical protein RL185_243 [Bacteroidota bacterium]